MNIFVEGWIHPKNLIGMNLMNKKGINFYTVYDHNVKYDWIMNSDTVRDYEGYTKLIFGPHMLVESMNQPNSLKDKIVYYNQLSLWTVNLYKTLLPNYNFVALPFAVDVEKFRPVTKNGIPFIYFKQRDAKILQDFLNKNSDKKFILFEYSKGYDEQFYLDILSKAPYGIWIGGHESQGFAFQEALSCDCPLFVIDVKSLTEGVSHDWTDYWTNLTKGHQVSATSASYFDESCGLICYPENWELYWNTFLNNIKNYTPRNFIINNLSDKACVDRWTSILK